MKKIVFLAFLILFLVPAMAQSPINLGIKAGYNSAKLTVDKDDFNEDNINKYHVGAFARVNLGNIYLQPEAYFNTKGGKIKEMTSSTSQIVNSFNLKTLDVPVLLGVKIIKNPAFNLRANAGPVFSIVTDKDIKSDQFDSGNIKDSFMAWQYGLGADFLFLTLDVRMENGSGDLYSGPELDSKSKSFVVSLGFKIL